MAEYDVKLNGKQLLGLLNEGNALSEMVSDIINQVLEAQMSEHLGANRYEHNEDRTGYRNGYRSRTLYTRVGPLNLRIPQTRDGSFDPQIFKRYQRHEQAFVAGIMEMYINGVSTRKVTKLTEELCGTKFSKSTVSMLCTGIDDRVNIWRQRDLSEHKYPFVLVDALVVDIRNGDAIYSMGVLIAYGINEQGKRETLDLMIADSESEHSWDKFFKQLKDRGLSGVDLVISDAHSGLVKALKRNYQNAQWQRCQVHFMRNILGHASRKIRAQIAEPLKLIFQAPDKKTARKLAQELINKFADKAETAMQVLEDGLENALTVLQLPKAYRQRLRTTNMPERVNEEIRRRQRVIRIFPNTDAALRLIGALLADIHDDWRMGNRYFDMTEYHDWKKELEEENKKNKVVTIA